ncbi:uncharacterized protein LOC117533571 [Gymnodraco acuticeps]|uniref:Uncharacterized protein LOC117533571 n=1 Tax=Gymnodraco acuticeps TaxID=8218 RepID=A0A6P8SRG6_GYMAC|nr:uncharacterized protein LOC117533571 [Gymnodraco acuticeps]
MSSNKKGGDERFLRVQKDPRFWEMPERERKIKIDKRFQSMFHDKRFTEKYTVDKRGRPINQTSTEDLKRFYNVSSSEDEDDDEEGVKSKKKKEVKEELVKVEIEVKVEKEVKVEIEVKVEKEVKESKDVKAEGPPPERGVRVIEEDELVRYTAAEKTFTVRKDTFLARSLEQHAWKFDRVTGEALVVVHIGTDDVASGLSPAAIVGQMEALIDRIQHGHAEPLYVGRLLYPPPAGGQPKDDGYGAGHQPQVPTNCVGGRRTQFTSLPGNCFSITDRLFKIILLGMEST